MSRLAIALALSLVAFVAHEVPAQTYSCFSSTSETTLGLRDDVIALVTGTDVRVIAKRDTLKLLAASASQVSVITQTNKCKSAGESYHSVLQPGSPQISRSMVVIKIANNRYVITDPAERQGEFGTVMITDSNFNVLAMMSL
ncbi:MAG TPA: hypothetical protein VJ717_16175 [Gemmatimonadaceae bacterium]|nr:hypothetical protein [Gemmatimonadaceae bacterium]